MSDSAPEQMTWAQDPAVAETLRRYLTEARICRVGTSGPDGPHVAPFCPAFDGDRTLYIQTERNVRTVRNLQHDARSVVIVDDYSEDWSGQRLLSVEGVGRSLAAGDGAEYEKAAELLKGKFPQFDEEGIDVRFVLTIDLRRVRRTEGL